MICNFPKVLNFKQLFLKVHWFICNSWAVLPVHCTKFNTLHNSSYIFSWIRDIYIYINMWANTVSKGVSKACHSKLLYPDNVATELLFVRTHSMFSWDSQWWHPKCKPSCRGSMHENLNCNKKRSTKCQDDEDNISPLSTQQLAIFSSLPNT